MELAPGSLLGPFTDKSTSDTHMNPIMSRPQKASSHRRIILELSYAQNNQSVNSGIPKCSLEGEYIRTSLPTPQHLARELLLSGKNTYMYSMDLARAYRQLWIDPGDWPLMGICWKGQWYVDKTPAFGVRLGAHFCIRTQTLFVTWLKNMVLPCWLTLMTYWVGNCH